MEENEVKVEQQAEVKEAAPEKKNNGGKLGMVTMILNALISVTIFVGVTFFFKKALREYSMWVGVFFIPVSVILGIVSMIISGVKKNGGKRHGVFCITFCWIPFIAYLLGDVLRYVF